MNEKESDECWIETNVSYPDEIVTIKDMISQLYITNIPFSKLSDDNIIQMNKWFPKESKHIFIYKQEILKLGVPENKITYRLLIEAIDATNGDITSPKLKEYLTKEELI